MLDGSDLLVELSAPREPALTSDREAVYPLPSAERKPSLAVLSPVLNGLSPDRAAASAFPDRLGLGSLAGPD